MNVRSFDWRDFALLQRVRNRGVCLHSQLRYTRGPHAIQNKFLEMFTPSRSIHTFVVRPDQAHAPEALGQVQIQENYPQAHLAYLTPEEALQTDSGVRLLESMAQAAAMLPISSRSRGCPM